MTSVIAWISANRRRATGLYFASDSRRSWEGQSVHRDDCIKLFAAEGTHEIFAFAGDATFPPDIIHKICLQLESNPSAINQIDSPYQRSALIYKQITVEFEALNLKPKYGFSILHGTRNGAMFGATFHLFEYSYDKTTDKLSYGIIPIDTTSSVTLNTVGTGNAIIKSFVKSESKKLGDVSKALFSAFCKAVASDQDPYSGGPIQLVGILSIKTGLHFGVHTPGGRFYKGDTHLPANHAELRWRNCEFDNVDAHGLKK